MTSFGDFIAGLVTGEGYFSIKLRKMSELNTGIQVFHCFGIKLGIYDRSILEKIQARLGCGYIYDSKKIPPNGHYRTSEYKVYKFADLLHKIVPFFEEHPLQGRKKEDFELWKKSLFLRSEGKHLIKQGIREIANIRNSMNKVSRHNMMSLEVLEKVISS